MYDNDSKGISYTGGFFMLIGFALIGLFLATLISIPVWQGMTGTPVADIEKGLTNPANANAAKVLQVINVILGFFIPTVVVAAVLHRRPARLLGFTGRVKISQAVLVLLILVTGLFVSSGLAYFNNHIPLSGSLKALADKMELNYNRQTAAIMSVGGTKEFLLALLMMAVIPAICEEVLFRGGLQNFLTRGTNNAVLSIIAVSILFSIVHFSWYGFLSRFFLGMVLGFIYYYSGRLWLSILAHFLNNAAAVAYFYFTVKKGASLPEVMSDQTTSYAGIFLLPVVVGLLLLYKRVSTRKTSSLQA